MQTIIEQERRIPVIREVDVVVCGSGPAGVCAAVAAARNGAKTLLVERYGYLGGMMTGSHVTWLLGFGNGEKQVVFGLGDELARRLEEVGGITKGRGATSGDCNTDAEFLKWMLAEMTEEAGAEILLHSLTTAAIVEDGCCRGVIIESKSGREAIRAKVTIDATADADVCVFAGAETTNDTHDITLVHRFEGIDRQVADAYAKEHPEEYAKLLEQLAAAGGELPGKNTPYYKGLSAVDRDDLTHLELECRRKALKGLVFAREHLPGYADAMLRWTAPQLGVRESRKLVGGYTLTEEDLQGSARFDDTIGKCGAHLLGYALYKFPGIEYDLPYRCLVPQQVDGLLAAGRCISTTHLAMNTMRLIVPCFLTGEAAGTAAAIAAAAGVEPRAIDVAELQRRMREQGNSV